MSLMLQQKKCKCCQEEPAGTCLALLQQFLDANEDPADNVINLTLNVQDDYGFATPCATSWTNDLDTASVTLLDAGTPSDCLALFNRAFVLTFASMVNDGTYDNWTYEYNESLDDGCDMRATSSSDLAPMNIEKHYAYHALQVKIVFKVPPGGLGVVAETDVTLTYRIIGQRYYYQAPFTNPVIDETLVEFDNHRVIWRCSAVAQWPIGGTVGGGSITGHRTACDVPRITSGVQGGQIMPGTVVGGWMLQRLTIE